MANSRPYVCCSAFQPLENNKQQLNNNNLLVNKFRCYTRKYTLNCSLIKSYHKTMGGALSHFFQSGSALLTHGNYKGVSEPTKAKINIIFDALRANPKVTVQRLEGILTEIPKNENILGIHNQEGYNLLQKCIGVNNVELVKWVLSRHIDINRGACSLPLHIACLKGHQECVEVLLKYGAKVEVEARMCWPGPHNLNCEERGKYNVHHETMGDRSSDKLQSAIYYAIDGDQVEILELLLSQQGEDHWLFPWQQKRPLLHIACEKGAWNCVRYLVTERSEEINQCHDELYPIHQAIKHDVKFAKLLLSHGADATVRTATQQMTVLHVLFLLGRRSAADTLIAAKLLLEHGCREVLNSADSLGNTPLHGVFVRYALEDASYGYDHDQPPWNKWDMLHLVRYLLQHGASPSINQPGNSALACVIRHVRDWDTRYELLDMLLQVGGDPAITGRDGSVPLMVCLVPLINKDHLHHLTHNMKVCYLNCVRLLCKYKADPNCSSSSNLTPLHVLVFTAGESLMLSRENEFKSLHFEFVRRLLDLLLQHGLEPNARISKRTQHVLQRLAEMVATVRCPEDLNYIYDLTLTLLQYGADPNVELAIVSANSTSQEPTICHSQSSVYLKSASNNVLHNLILSLCKREEILLDKEQHFVKLIQLYYMCMEHKPLFSCLRNLLSQDLYSQAGLISVRSGLCTHIRDLYNTPRTLKQMSRVVIYNAMQKKPGLHVNKLPLPIALKDYLLNFQP